MKRTLAAITLTIAAAVTLPASPATAATTSPTPTTTWAATWAPHCHIQRVYRRPFTTVTASGHLVRVPGRWYRLRICTTHR